MSDPAAGDGHESEPGADADSRSALRAALAVVREPEVERRLVHTTGTLAPLSYLLGVLTWPQLGWALLACSLGVALLEAARLTGALDLAIYDRLTREYEQENVAGYALYVVSVTGVVLLFEPRVAVPAVLALSLGDPVSGLLSSGEVGDVKQGYVLLATFGVATAVASPFVPAIAAVACGLATTLADGVKPAIRGYVLDDNLTIPPAAALAMTGAIALSRRLAAQGLPV